MKNTLAALAAALSIAPVAGARRPGPPQGQRGRPHLRGQRRRALLLAGRHRLAALHAVLEGRGRGLPLEPRRQGLHRHPGRPRLGPRQRHGGEVCRSPTRRARSPGSTTIPTKPNPAYFEHVDHLVDYANSKGLVLAMLPTWGYYVKEVRVLDAANARAYGRWLGARYKNAPNVVWVNGGDRTPTGFEDVFRELARGLREGDGGAHLITYHPCGWRSSAQFFHAEDWLDFNMIETWTEWAKIYPAVVADAVRAPRKPVVLGEGAYEDGPEYPQGPITPLLVRRQAWWTVMAGGFHTYGQNQMWRMEPGWDKTFDTPGAAQVCLMKRIVTGLPWWDLLPDQGDLRDRHRQRAHPEHRHALEGRHPRPHLPLEPHDRLPPPRQDRGEVGEGHLDQPGHRREEGRRHLRDRQPHRQAPSPPLPRSSSRPRTSGRTRSCCWRVSTSRVHFRCRPCARSVPIVGQHVAQAGLEVPRLHEPDAPPAAVRAQHPGQVLHVAQRRMSPVGVAAARDDREGNPESRLESTPQSTTRS